MGPDYLDTHHVGLSFTNFSSYPYLKQYILDWLSTLLRIKILFLWVIKTMASGYRKCISTNIYHSHTMEDCFQRPSQTNTVPRQVKVRLWLSLCHKKAWSKLQLAPQWNPTWLPQRRKWGEMETTDIVPTLLLLHTSPNSFTTTLPCSYKQAREGWRDGSQPK